MRTIIVCGGGTAGHVMPIIALIPQLKEHFDKILFIGSENGMEKNICEKYLLPFRSISPVKFSRKKFFQNLKIPFKLHTAIKQAGKIIDETKPVAVFSKGGYVALPTVIAASRRKIPVIAHECDMSLGLANKVSMRYVNKLITSFQETQAGKKGIFIGTPIRESIFCGNGNIVKERFNLDNKPMLLVFGGSSGAKKINECISECAKELVKEYNIINITGNNKMTETDIKGYFQIQFADDIENYIDAADTVISRAGASAALELLACGKKVLFIPLPKGNSRGDQELNAEYYTNKGYAMTLKQDLLNCENLLGSLKKLQETELNKYDYDKKIPEKIVHCIISEIE